MRDTISVGSAAERAYRDREPLAARAGIYRFQRDRVDLEAEVAAGGVFRMTNRVGVFTCRP